MGVPLFVLHAACVRDTRRCTPQYCLAEPPRLLTVSRHALVPHPCRSCAVPLALLQGEMTLLILRATPTPTGGIPAQLGLPSGEGALGLRRRACPGGRAPSGHARRVEVPRQRCARGAGRPPGCGESLWPRVVERSIQAIGGSPILTLGTQAAIPGDLLSAVISTRYILSFRKGNPNVSNMLVQNLPHC